jgi:hypothetical protein
MKPSLSCANIALNVFQKKSKASARKTYHSPENAFQLQDKIRVFAFLAMLSYELGKFYEMSLLLQNLTAEFCLRHFAIEVSWNNSVEFTGKKM